MKPRIFISCVTKEFGTTRQRVANILARLGYEPVWQDIFGTESGDIRQMLRDKIDGCQGLIQIAGHAYGFEPPSADPEFGRISYTQFEFLYAQRCKKKTWLFFAGDACTRDTPLDQLDLPGDPPPPDPAAWQAERRKLQADYCQQLASSSHLWRKPANDTELDLAVERLDDKFAKLRRWFRRWQWAVLGSLLAALVGLGALFGMVQHSSKQSEEEHKALRAQLEALQKRDAPGSELLTEFRQRLNAASFSAVKADPDQRVSTVLADLARERRMTVDELRRKILQAATGASERIELAGRLRRASESEATRMRQIERDGYKDLAAAALGEQQPARALEHYQQALALTTRADEVQEWAGLQQSLAVCHLELGIRVEGASANQHLRDAAAAFREALKVYTRERLPQDWMRTQNNLGIALNDQAGRSEGAEAARLLGEAVTAYREALKVYTREQLPQLWAAIQNNLGAALREQAGRSEGTAAARLLGEAVAAFREALKVQTREQLPQDWAATQNNLGAALCEQAGRSEAAEAARLLGEAVAAFREALKVFTREQLPQHWAGTQNNLGLGLSAQAGRNEGAEAARLLGEAVAAFREALKVRTREQLPQHWAMTQNNLGAALREQAGRSEGTAAARLLGEAVAAYQNALQVFTAAQFPYQNGIATRGQAGAQEALRKLKP